MRKFAALFAVVSATAFMSPIAMAKTVSAPKAHVVAASVAKAPEQRSEKRSEKRVVKNSAKHAAKKSTKKSMGKTAKRETPARGPKGRFLPRQKA